MTRHPRQLRDRRSRATTGQAKALVTPHPRNSPVHIPTVVDVHDKNHQHRVVDGIHHAIVPDGASIVTASEDKTARVWDSVPMRERYEQRKEQAAREKPLRGRVEAALDDWSPGVNWWRERLSRLHPRVEATLVGWRSDRARREIESWGELPAEQKRRGVAMMLEVLAERREGQALRDRIATARAAGLRGIPIPTTQPATGPATREGGR
jgi:hypothetical protein